MTCAVGTHRFYCYIYCFRLLFSNPRIHICVRFAIMKKKFLKYKSQTTRSLWEFSLMMCMKSIANNGVAHNISHRQTDRLTEGSMGIDYVHRTYSIIVDILIFKRSKASE